MDGLDDFANFPFSFDGVERVVYRKGSGPAVVIMHELPGITPAVIYFANRVIGAGFTAFMPSLFGTPGDDDKGLPFGTYLKLCVRKEFPDLSTTRASPIVDWLRALARHAYAEIVGRGVGVVGMCVTGNFALTMALDAEVVAPILSQPALPTGIMVKHYRAVHASPEALANVRRRHRGEGLKVLGLQFKGDPLCPAARFDTLERELGDAFERRDIDKEHAARGGRFPHSVLTRELIDKEGEPTHDALERVLSFLTERLR